MKFFSVVNINTERTAFLKNICLMSAVVFVFLLASCMLVPKDSMFAILPLIISAICLGLYAGMCIQKGEEK